MQRDTGAGTDYAAEPASVGANAVASRAAAEEEPSRRAAEATPTGADRNVPGLRAIVIELVLGALRLFRTLVTAPLRLALALLRPVGA